MNIHDSWPRQVITAKPFHNCDADLLRGRHKNIASWQEASVHPCQFSHIQHFSRTRHVNRYSCQFVCMGPWKLARLNNHKPSSSRWLAAIMLATFKTLYFSHERRLAVSVPVNSEISFKPSTVRERHDPHRTLGASFMQECRRTLCNNRPQRRPSKHASSLFRNPLTMQFHSNNELQRLDL